MFKKLDNIIEPSSDTSIWRYMTFSKFISMLANGALFFSEMDKSYDQFEGAIPFEQAMMLRAYKSIEIKSKLEKSNFLDAKADEHIRDHFVKLEEEVKKYRFLIMTNCWHMNSVESYAMWKLYVDNEGVAVQTTYERYKNSLEDYGQDIYMGKVIYYEDKINDKDMLTRAFHKRAIFEHEREFRAISFGNLPKTKDEITDEHTKRYIYHGEYIPVKLDVLIDKILLSPAAPLWYKDIIENTLMKYGLKKDVSCSKLDDKPVFG